MDWIFPSDNEIPADLLAWTGNRLLAQLLMQRGISSLESAQSYLDPAMYEPALASDLPDIDKAVDGLQQAIETQQSICVWGDFDVDGQTSTALLVSMLQALGAKVEYHIPDRLTDGHGIQLGKLEQVLQSGVQLILTCDTGIEAYDAVNMVHDFEASIIITDHHDLGHTLPPAEAVINPKRLPPSHPLRELPGVGVAYKLAEALTKKLGHPELAADLLDLVALGIVADVAVQTGDTRYLLQQGLTALRSTKRPGLATLIKLANLEQTQLTAEHIGFWLGPRLNALGRLGDANQAVELLTTADTGRAQILSAQLDALNERRRMLVDRTVVQALSQLADTPSLAEYNAIVLASSEWHPGVIGIAASRLVERYYKPVILLTEREGLLRGSARSIAGRDIHQAIKTQATLLHSFGGHPMAAGLSLSRQRLSDFRRGLSESLGDCVAQVRPQLHIDAVVTLAECDLSLLHTIQKLAPFGAGNPPIQIAVTGLTLVKESLFGRARNHRRLKVADQAGHMADIVWWNSATESLPTGSFDCVLTINRDNYRRSETVQLLWVAARQQDAEAKPIERTIVDLRLAANPLTQIKKKESVFFAVDSLASERKFVFHQPQDLTEKTLVLWQSPPGQDLLQHMIATVQPETIIVVAKPAQFDTFSTFVNQLMGLVKYSLSQYGGRLDIMALAGALGHRPATIRLAIQWLISEGKLRLLAPLNEMASIDTGDILVVRPDNRPALYRSELLKQALLELLRETAAYRAFFQRANLAALGLGIGDSYA
ncbi:MAG: single-stranded-DNA-specific exonuclease RecJ [Chloroflexota bacterium]